MRSMARLVLSALIGVVTVFGFGLANSPANAAGSVRIFDGCDYKNAFLRVGVPFVMHVPDGCDYHMYYSPSEESSYSIVVSADKRQVTITLKQEGTRLDVTFDYPGTEGLRASIFLACPVVPNPPGSWPYTDYCDSTPVEEASTSEAREQTSTGAQEQAPKALIGQGLPMPATGSCDDVHDADYAWGTGLTGGWQKSWEPWVRSGGSSEATGGWACIRTLENMGGRWVIAN